QSARALVLLFQLSQRSVNVLLRLGVEQFVEGLRRQRFGRRKDERLDDRLQLGARAARQHLRAGIRAAIARRIGSRCYWSHPSLLLVTPFLPVPPDLAHLPILPDPPIPPVLLVIHDGPPAP